jgi:hypothetical protein
MIPSGSWFSHDADPTPEPGSATARPHTRGPEIAYREIEMCGIFSRFYDELPAPDGSGKSRGARAAQRHDPALDPSEAPTEGERRLSRLRCSRRGILVETQPFLPISIFHLLSPYWKGRERAI